MTLNGNEINLPSSVVIPFRDKFRARKHLRKELLLCHVTLKQGKTWLTLECGYRNHSIANDSA